MKKLSFKHSDEATIGVELEIQLVNPVTYDLISRAKDLIRNISASPYQAQIKPEITQSMIEINSSIHASPQSMYEEFLELQDFLLSKAENIGICFCGGGNHPFEKWISRKIFPTKRFKNLSRQYRYLSKHATIFGQHIHVGCKSGEDAIYLTHAMARYAPQLIAMSASSPFYQGVDTGYNSTRSTVFSSFPTGGVIPYLANWKAFTEYFYKMKNFGIIASMKDIYWDIRPKPEFGTIELRVCDMPLTIEKAVCIAAYAQALAVYLLRERPIKLSRDLYFLYHYNRFQACRYGFLGNFIDPQTSEHRSIYDDIMVTMSLIEEYIHELNNMEYIEPLINDVLKKHNDASTLRHILKQVRSFPKLVKEQCLIFNRTRSSYE